MFAVVKVEPFHAVNVTIASTGYKFELIYQCYRPSGAPDTAPMKYLFPVSLVHERMIRQAANGGRQDPMPVLRRAIAAALAPDGSIRMDSVGFRGETPKEFQVVDAARAGDKLPPRQPGPLAGARGKSKR